MSNLGKKFACFKCGCKFYDLNRTKAICPKCKANQAEFVPSATAHHHSPEPAEFESEIEDSGEKEPLEAEGEVEEGEDIEVFDDEYSNSRDINYEEEDIDKDLIETEDVE